MNLKRKFGHISPPGIWIIDRDREAFLYLLNSPFPGVRFYYYVLEWQGQDICFDAIKSYSGGMPTGTRLEERIPADECWEILGIQIPTSLVESFLEIQILIAEALETQKTEDRLQSNRLSVLNGGRHFAYGKLSFSFEFATINPQIWMESIPEQHLWRIN